MASVTLPLMHAAVVIFTLIVLTGSSLKTAAAAPCIKWVEVVDGKDAKTGKPAQLCDGMQGPRDQFAKLVKIAKVDLPTIKVRLQEEKDKHASSVKLWQDKHAVERKRADTYMAENKKLRELPPPVTPWYEHPATWGIGGVVVGVLVTVVIVETVGK